MLWYTTLHYTTLHYTILYYTILHYTTPHYTTLHCTSVYRDQALQAAKPDADLGKGQMGSALMGSLRCSCFCDREAFWVPICQNLLTSINCVYMFTLSFKSHYFCSDPISVALTPVVRNRGPRRRRAALRRAGLHRGPRNICFWSIFTSPGSEFSSIVSINSCVELPSSASPSRTTSRPFYY